MRVTKRDVYLPSVALARRLAKQRNLDGLLMIGFAGGEFCCASYGGTLRQCHELGKLVDFIVNAVEQEKVKLPSLDTGGPPPFAQDRSEYT